VIKRNPEQLIEKLAALFIEKEGIMRL